MTKRILVWFGFTAVVRYQTFSAASPSKQAVPSYNVSQYIYLSSRLWTFLRISHGIYLYHPSQLTIIYQLVQKSTPKMLDKEPKTLIKVGKSIDPESCYVAIEPM